MKQETTSEAFYRISKELDYSEFDFISFKIGIEWQQEQDKNKYSEEEVMDMFDKFSMHLPLHYEFLVKEQFKNK